MESRPKSELIRIACYEGEVTVDPAGKAKGRGIYLCRNSGCAAKARKKRALQRGFGIDISEEKLDEIFKEISGYEEQGE